MGTFTIQVNATNVWTGAQTFESDITITDADVVLATGTGTKIGTGTTQKLSFWNATPVVQPGHITDPTDLATSITALELILADLAELGLQAAS